MKIKVQALPALQLISVIMLVVALGHHPYVYYQVLRWTVSATSAYTAFLAYKQSNKIWTWILGVTAIVFNPISPLYLNRQIWSVLNLIAASIIIVSRYKVKIANSNLDDRSTEQSNSDVQTLKPCVFCKKEIHSNSIRCPHCTRTLREQITVNKPNAHIQTPPQERINIQKIRNKYSDLFLKLNINNYLKHKKWIVMVTIVIFVIIALTRNSRKLPQTSTTYRLPELPKIQEVVSKFSLPQGTVLSKNVAYFNGLGELKISNGTKLDAVAKLISSASPKSALTVYVRAETDYTISKIKDGNYKLYFNLGNDWSTSTQKFLRNSSFQKFEEIFDFRTKKTYDNDYAKTEYAVFRVTLNPVLGGSARTEDVSEEEFQNY